MSLRAQPHICDLLSYQPGLPVELVARRYGLNLDRIVKLASNENPLGMSPKAREAAKKALGAAHCYPEQYALTQALAAHHGVDPAMVVLGSGSNDVLDLIARVFLDAGDESVSAQYAFAVYAIATQAVGARNVVVPARHYGHDLAGMLRAITSRTRVVWIANPNNPTGTFIPYAGIKLFLERVPEEVMVVLDEAYYDYLEPADRSDASSWITDHPNLILVRTFSKVYGLAGLRVGYGLAAPQVAELLNRVRLPFNVTLPALAAAIAALDDQLFVQKSLQTNRKGRVQLLRGLKALNLECMPAYGNFATFQIPKADMVHEHLLEQGIIIRPLVGYGLPDWLRVTIGTLEENQRFLHALSRVQTQTS